MGCSCQTGNRRLLVFTPDLAESFTELWDFQPGEGWEPIPSLNAIQVDIGPALPWQTTRELVNFLRSVLDEPRLKQLRAAWVEQCVSLSEQLPNALQAQPITDLAPLDASPLTEVLQSRRLDTWFQPVVTASDLRVWGYECLVRGRTAEGETISPKDLFQWAEQEQLTFMLDRVCREMHLRNAGQAGLPDNTRLLINFLPTSIYDPAFCLRTTVKTANEVDLDPGCIVFEVVESEHVPDREHLMSILSYYRQNGFSVALDDVGSGYSGLMMLAELNPDLIKIDREMVRRAPDSRLHRSVCRSLVDLARESGKMALAEGIETAEQKAIMDELGVDLYQGFYFSKPSPEPVDEIALEATRH
jgi:EAL domain-containing protein (putative c-di-GMP-specific phosphodiesterase class I)